MIIQALFLTLGVLSGPARADFSDSGSLIMGDQAVVGGSMTVQGNAFSVGSSTLVVAGGKTGLGVSPLSSDRLTIVKTANDTISRANTAVWIGDNSLDAGLALQQTLSSPYGFSLQGMDSAGNTLPIVLNKNGGYVGIGASPDTKLTVRSLNLAASLETGNVNIQSSDSADINKGGVLGLGGAYSGTSQQIFGTIAGRKETAVNGEYGGYLQFSTVKQGVGIGERMRIDSTGNVGIGVTPTSKLHVSGEILGTSSITGAHFGDGSHLTGIGGAGAQFVAGSTLAMNGGAAQGLWYTPASGSSVSALGGSSSLTFSNLVSSQAYKLTISASWVGTSGNLLIRFNSDSGSVYDWTMGGFNSAGTVIGTSGGSAQYCVIGDPNVLLNDAHEHWQGEIIFSGNPGGKPNNSSLRWIGNQTSDTIVSYGGACNYRGSAPLSSVTLLTSAGRWLGPVTLQALGR